MKYILSVVFFSVGVAVGYVICENELGEKHRKIQTLIYFENALNVLEKEAMFLEDFKSNGKAADNLYCANIKRLSWIKAVDRTGADEFGKGYATDSIRLKEMEDFYGDESKCE